jgi:hypothetical protein
MLGPSKTISSKSQQKFWAHLRPLAACLSSNFRLQIPGSLKTISSMLQQKCWGPFKTSDSIPCERHWAHPRPLAVCLGSNAGPIRDHRSAPRQQCWAHLRPSTAHLGKCWAHLRPSAAHLSSDAWPIQDHRQHVLAIICGLDCIVNEETIAMYN